MYVLVICSYQTFKFCASLYQPEGQFPLSTKTGGMKSKICKKKCQKLLLHNQKLSQKECTGVWWRVLTKIL